MVVKEAVDILKTRNCKHEDKEAAYANLLRNLTTQAVWDEEPDSSKAELVKLLYRDILDADEKVVLNAFHLLNMCHGQEDAESFEKNDSELGLRALFQCGHKTSSLEVIKCILDCLSVQRFHTEVLSNKISALLTFIEEMHLKVKAQSTSVVEKIVKVFVRLEKQIGRLLKPLSPRWSRLIFPGLANASTDVREESLSLLEKFREDLVSAPDLSKVIIKALNDGLSKTLKTLMYTHESYVLRTWPLIVQVTGKELHKGSTVNSLLEIIEIGFKGSHVGRHNAFIAWRALIDNFALDRALLLDSKRIKLLLMVLRIDNAKVEHVTVEKLHTWWHFCLCIGAKLSVNFEMIVHPLLQFCVGNGKLQSTSDLGQSPRLALKNSANNICVQSPKNAKYNLPVFPVIQKLGCQVIARLISKVGKSEDPGKITWAFDALPEEVFGSSAIFVKHAPVLMTSLETLLINVGNHIEENLILHIWTSLGNHLKAAMDSTVKTECRDIFSAYLTILHTMVKSLLPAQTILKMIQICCSFPQKVLASTAYNITGGQTVRACPAQLLCEVLLTGYVMESAGAQDSFTKLFSSLMNAGASNLQGALLFLQTVTEMLDLQSVALTSPEVLWRMWSTLANTLKDTISTTNEVNQGDALEYNFGCMYAVLLLPIKHQLSSKISQALNKALIKTWKDLYHSFARLSALVATAEANTCFEEMCAKITESWNPELQDPLNLEFVSNVCCKMLECMDFSAVLASQAQGSGLTLSPSKWVRRRQRPMGNLHSFVHLLASLQTELNSLLSLVDDSGSGKKQASTSSMVSYSQTQVEAHTKLFAHVTSNGVISNCLAVLAAPLAKFYQPNTKSNGGGALKLFVISFWTKLEKLWQEITQCIVSRYNGSFDAEFLGHVTPLLEATFLHNRRTIRSKTLALWNATFGRNPALEYTSSLRNTLLSVRERNAIILPGLVTNDEAVVVAETPFSEMSMGDSQVPAPIVPLLAASPKHHKGSLLHRDLSPAGKLSPKPKASPAKMISPKNMISLLSGARKRIDLDLLPKETFVVIDSPTTKKKRILTEHQKEVLKQKCVLPAMYSSIDSSQDVSLMSQFGTETQQSMSCADVIVVSSSQSQEHTNLPQKGAKSSKDNKANELSGGPHFRRSNSSSPRKSVRIQEVMSSDDFKFSEIKARDASTVFMTELDFNQMPRTEPPVSGKIDDKNRVGEKDKPEKQKSDTLGKSSPSDACETHTDTSHNSQVSQSIKLPSTDPKDADSPFLMFRTKQQTGTKISLSQSTKSPRRIALRKVRSQDDIPLSKLKEDMSPNKMKAPRRVPLKKINEQECELGSESINHKKSSDDKLHGSSLSSESKLGSCDVFSEQNETNNTELPIDSAINFQAAEQVLESDSSVDVSCTLVEDTQSPFKVKHHNKEADHSIAETPLKGGDNSISPPVRSASARKLFVDCETTSASQTQRADPEQAARDTADQGEAASVLENSEMTSSQGFEVDVNLEVPIPAGQNIIEPSLADSVKECIEVNHCEAAVTMAESESLFPSTQISSSPMDMMMPTLSSPFQRLTSSSNSSSQGESQHISSSNDSSKAPSKASPSPEVDFNCSMPTLTEEVLPHIPNKRKRGTPKKLVQVNTKRGCKKHRKAMKGCQYCRNVRSSCNIICTPVSESKSAIDCKNMSVSLPQSDTRAPQVMKTASQISTSTPKYTIANELLVLEAPLNSQDTVEFTKIKNSDTALQEIGEITPDMKSPKSNPERRHSSAKRMKRLSERKVEKSHITKSSASKKIRIESTDSDKSNSDSKTDKERAGDSGEPAKTKLKSMSPHGKRQPAVESPGKLDRNKKKLKRQRKEQPSEQKHSSPKKLKTDDKDLSEEDEDSISLSSFLKKYKKDESCSVSKVDDNNIETGNQAIPEVQDAANAAAEVPQNSVGDATPDMNVSMHCSEADLLIIDAAVNTALHWILLESSSTARTNKPELIPDKGVETAATATSGAPESPVTDTPDISPDHMEAEQSVIIVDILGSNTQQPVTANNSSVLEDSVSSEREQLVEVGNVTDISNLAVAGSPKEDISIGSLGCNEDENIVTAETPQHGRVLDKCVNSEGAQINHEQTHSVDAASEQLDINNSGSSTLKSGTGENGAGPAHRHENIGSPERSAIVIYDWSPSRSPSCSILKRCVETPPLGKSRRVSFAEPVVSGESPVREFYKEFISTSPMVPQHTSSPGQKASLFNKVSQGKVSKYRRRLEPLKKQEAPRSPLSRKIVSPQTQSSYKPTQESQLDSSRPVCPELVDCTNPLDDILPQLTSSLWYRGLCQLMKGRNINTIGDLSALTEVQIDQLPIRHPKVETVKSTLSAYMAQHGLAKSASNGEVMPDPSKNVRSKGSTIEQGGCITNSNCGPFEITPASIDDEGIEVHPGADDCLKALSPITDCESETQRMQPVLPELETGSSCHVTNDHSVPLREKSCGILTGLKEVAKQCEASDLKKASLDELFDIHQALNLLFTNVVEEMKSRHSSA